MSDATPREPIFQFFKYDHLPEKLQTVSKPFGELAQRIEETLPRNAERSVALRKLLEAKDAAVRALLATTVAFLLLFPLAAFAQAAAAIDPGPAPDLTVICQQLFDAVQHGQWWIVVSVLVSALTWLFRAQVFNRLPAPVGPWFVNHPLVGFATPFGLSAIGGLAVALKSGTPFTAALLVGEILKVGAGAVAAYIGAKKIAEASVLGAVARGEVATAPAAIALLAQGPQAVASPPAPVGLEAAAAQLLGAPSSAVLVPGGESKTNAPAPKAG